MKILSNEFLGEAFCEDFLRFIESNKGVIFNCEGIILGYECHDYQFSSDEERATFDNWFQTNYKNHMSMLIAFDLIKSATYSDNAEQILLLLGEAKDILTKLKGFVPNFNVWKVMVK